MVVFTNVSKSLESRRKSSGYGLQNPNFQVNVRQYSDQQESTLRENAL